ncbi:MAG: TonB C-terminal domain-containing protein [Cyanobacteria bacterium SZAS TMP-1]|nr:TonB C-terminal domain-containing protein [Cyanobacteria bacterium SZAS TMP-1]
MAKLLSKPILSYMVTLALASTAPAIAAQGADAGAAKKTAAAAKTENHAKPVKVAPLTIRDKWAVVFGVGHYQDPAIKPIKYASRNVLTLSESFCDPAAGHFPQDHVLVVTEDKVTKDAVSDATWSNWLSKKALPNDMIVLYFCLRFAPSDDASDLLMLTQESTLASKETSATSLSSVLGEVHRRTQCKNIVALLDLSPTAESAKNFPYGFGTLLESIGKKTGATIISADERALGSLDDPNARTSYFVEYLCEGLKAGGGALPLEAVAGYVSQTLASLPPAQGDNYHSHPMLWVAPDNAELAKIPLGLAVKNPNSIASVKIGKPISAIAQTDPALAAHLTQLEKSGSTSQKLSQMKKAQEEQEERERQEEEEDDQASDQEVDFAPYMATMKKTIQGKWSPPKGLDQKTVVAVFSIQRDGRIVEPEIVESSGNPTIDQSALKALADASPLGPLPKGAPKKVQIRYKFDWKVSN